MGRTLVSLAQRGLEAEAAARTRLDSAYEQFMADGDLDRKDNAGKELIRAIFEKAAIAEDPVR